MISLTAIWKHPDTREAFLRAALESADPDPFFRALWAAGIVAPVVNPRAVRRLCDATRQYRTSAEYHDARFRARRRRRCCDVVRCCPTMWWPPEQQPGTTRFQPKRGLTTHASGKPEVKKVKKAIDGVTRCAVSDDRMGIAWDDDLDAWVYVDEVVVDYSTGYVAKVACL